MSLDWRSRYALLLDVADFDGDLKWLNGRTKLTVTGAELVWAAVMVGFPDHLHVLAASGSGWPWVLAHRVAIVQAHVEEAAEYIAPSEAFIRADGSEKTAISYYLGLFAAKVVAARLLRVPWLQHFDGYYRDRYGSFPRGRRPDLIGPAAAGHWYVLEAKGRFRGCRGNLIADAKDQTRSFQVPSPAGAGIASIAHFQGGQWQVVWRDPDTREGAPLDDYEERAVLDGYYTPVVRAVAEAGRIVGAEPVLLGGENDLEYAAAELPGADTWVAIPEAALAAQAEGRELAPIFTSSEHLLTRASPEEWDDLLDIPMADRWVDEGRAVFDMDEREWVLGLDGVAVRLGSSWTATRNR